MELQNYMLTGLQKIIENPKENLHVMVFYLITKVLEGERRLLPKKLFQHYVK